MTQVALADRHYLEWFAYDDLDTPAVVFDSRHWDYSGFMLMSMTGASDNLADAKSVSSPGQVGETMLDVDINGKVLVLSVFVASTVNDRPGYWVLKNDLIRAFYTPKPRGGALPRLGKLILYRPGQPAVEVMAFPRRSPKESSRPDSASMVMSVELYVPSAYWTEDADVISPLLATSGFHFPLEMPFEIASANTEAIITNHGHTEVPIVGRIYGEVENPSLTLVSTGEVIKIIGTVESDEYVEFSTEHGNKYVTLHKADLSTENWLANLDLTVSEFWQLPRGVQTIEFVADTNIGGSAEVVWRPKYAGA